MTRGNAGEYIKQHLHDHHLTDIMDVAKAAAKAHQDPPHNCRHADGWEERLKAMLLAHLPDIIGEAVEAEETFCPERGIGVKEAA